MQEYQEKPDICGSNGLPTAASYVIDMRDEYAPQADYILDVIDDAGCLRKEWVSKNALDPEFHAFVRSTAQGAELLARPSAARAVRFNAWLANEPPEGTEANLLGVFQLDARAPLVKGQLACQGLFADSRRTYRAGEELFWCYGTDYAREYRTSCPGGQRRLRM